MAKIIDPWGSELVEDYEKIAQGDNISIDVSNLEGDLFIDADGQKIPVVPAYEPKDVPVLKAGGALPYFNQTHSE